MKNQGFINRLEAGNAFIIILIMIALLTALTLSITRMGNNSSEVPQEQAGVIASQVLRQANTIANAVNGLLSKGCSLTQLSFDNTIVTGFTNVQSPSDKSCWIFDSAGAGLTFPVPPKSANDATNWTFVRGNNVVGVGPERDTGVSNSGTDCSPMTDCQDLIAILPFVDANVCKAIDVQANIIPSFGTAPPTLTGTIDLRYKFYSPSSTPSQFNYSLLNNASFPVKTTAAPPNTSAIWDKKAACVEINAMLLEGGGNALGPGKYIFYQVLVER